MNGIEAHEMGNPKRHDDPLQANHVPFIAMCNLMALEAVKMLGEQNPTTTNCHKLANGSDREKEISDFWKKTFQPIALQAEWAWSAVLALISGSEDAWDQIINNHHEQL